MFFCSDSLVALFKMGVIMFLKKSLSVLFLMVVTSLASANSVPTNWFATDNSSLLFSSSSTSVQLGIFDGVTDNLVTTVTLAPYVPATLDWDSSLLSGVASNFKVASYFNNVWNAPSLVLTPFGLIDTYVLNFGGFGPNSQFVLAHDIQPVPLPSAVWMFGAGLVGLLSSVGRKKRISANVVTA
ncbi:hypothetical protein GO003_009655 [Methylicorpusculum oleiharenae]|uniref:hypothetical protein n=1 Tax=Methylicorpusculum oleiharenae TaxID=1338687 RepID=UPI00135CE91D|nr:hypothetical protein [Methylicorpusculum oleiharenae]MCD2450655.1 hypothetical protein [Methylicorpusculum oleiharenae]